MYQLPKNWSLRALLSVTPLLVLTLLFASLAPQVARGQDKPDLSKIKVLQPTLNAARNARIFVANNGSAPFTYLGATDHTGIFTSTSTLLSDTSYLSLWPAYEAASSKTFNSDITVPLEIDPIDPSTVTSTITIPDTGTIAHLEVLKVRGTHTWVGDLEMFLQGPDGTEVPLMLNQCWSEQNFDLGFSSDAPADPPCPPTDGDLYRPVGDLNAFRGKQMSGDWTLRIDDNVYYDGGDLQEWSLRITPQSTDLGKPVEAPLYYTNLKVDPTALTYEKTVSVGDATITLTATHPLLIFNLDVSLEWDAWDDEAYLNRLEQDLKRTSALLYDWTNGTVLLGQINIYYSREIWDEADIRIYASNSLRPHADVGGSVITSTAIIGVNGTPTGKDFEPGHVSIGANWNRYGASQGVAGEDWPRALAHELGHYLLFLEDSYLGFDKADNLIQIDGCRGAMSDPYSESESEFQTEVLANTGCDQTLSYLETGRPDWTTIGTYYPDLAAQIPTKFNEVSGPSQPPLEPSISIIDNLWASRALLSSPVFRLESAQGQLLQPGPNARAYLFELNEPVDSDTIVELGWPSSSQFLVPGAHVGDRLCVFDPDHDVFGCEVLSEQDRSLSVDQPTWRPDVRIRPLSTTELEVKVYDSDSASKSLAMQLFPIGGTASILSTLVKDGNGYSGTITTADSLDNALLQIVDTSSTTPRETIVGISLFGQDGAQPADVGGFVLELNECTTIFCKRHAPASNDGQLTLYALPDAPDLPGVLSLATAPALPAPPPAWSIPVGKAYWLFAQPGTDAGVLQTQRVNISYADVDVPVGTEPGLKIYHWSESGGWKLVGATRRDLGRNELGGAVAGEGLYVLMSTLDMSAGWNLFSYPWQAATPLEAGLARLSGAGRYSMVYGYEAASGWKAFDANLPAVWRPLVNTLTTLEYGKGYWINVTAPTGSAMAMARPMAQRPALDALEPSGATLPFSPPATFYGAVPNAEATAKLTVEAMIDGNWCASAQTQVIAETNQAGFVLTVPSDTEKPGCGASGKQVQFVVKQGTAIFKTGVELWSNNQANLVDFQPLEAPGSKVFLPMITRATAQQPDLQIVDVSIVPTPAGSSQTYEVRVTVRNTGSGVVTTPFWVDLYVNPRVEPMRGVGWPDIADFGASWRVYTLNAGQTLTLSSLSPNDPHDPARNYTALPQFVTGTNYTFYAQADVYDPNNGPSGLIGEANENNNIGGPYVLTPRVQ